MAVLRVVFFVTGSIIAVALVTYSTQAVLIWYGEMDANDAFVRGFWSATGMLYGFWLGRFV